MIKYKGNTGELLKDVCIELKISVNLKLSEEILKHFFQIAFKDLNTDKSIELITCLPATLKPFYLFSKSKPSIEQKNENLIKVNFQHEREHIEINHQFFTQEKLTTTVKCLLKVFDKHIPPANLITILSLIPEIFFSENQPTVCSKVAVC